MNFPRWRSTVRPDDEAGRARIERLAADASPEAEAFKDHLAETGVALARGESPRESAERLLPPLEARLERLENKLAAKKEAQMRPGYEHRGDASIARVEAEIAQVEAMVVPLWGALNRPSLRDADPDSEPILCRYCSTHIDRHTAYECGGSCVACARLGSGLDKPPKPDAEQARVRDLIARL